MLTAEYDYNEDIAVKQEDARNIGLEKGLQALVRSLKNYIKDFEALYVAVVSNEEYKDVTRDQVRRYV